MFEERIKFINECLEEIDFKISLKINSKKNIPYFKADVWDVEFARVQGALEALREVKRHFELSLAAYTKKPVIKLCRYCSEECPEGEEVWRLARTTAQYCMNISHYGSDDVLHLDCVLKIENFMLEEQSQDIMKTQLERD